MTSRACRVAELVGAFVCATLATLKLVGPTPDAAAVAVGVVEAAFAAWFLLGVRPRAAAWALVLFGLLLALVAATASPPAAADGRCGCLGPFRAGRAARIVVAGLLVGVAGLRLAAGDARPRPRERPA